MNEYELICRVKGSFPDEQGLWDRVRLEVAKCVAEDLIASLEAAPGLCGREYADRAHELHCILDITMRKGA